MKLRRLTIAGFRGFNEERSIDFDERLTVIAARNSHGKTSISEALEFLIYGSTSKVEKADFSKEEYKDSYRNRHFPADKPAYVEATFAATDNSEQKLRVELDADGTTTRRFVNGQIVDMWPFYATSLAAAKPFVLQHALKYLLLVPPSQRYQGFAALLGLNEIDGVFQAIISLCTKPTASLSPEGQRILNELANFETRISAVPELKKVSAGFKHGHGGLANACTLIETRADALLGGSVKTEERLGRLIGARTEAAAKIYSGDVAFHAYSPAESNQLASSRKTLSTAVDANFIEDYGRLCAHGAIARLQKEVNLLNVSVEFLAEDPDVCPLCGQPLSDQLRESIHKRHGCVKVDIEKCTIHEQSRSRVSQTLEDVKTELRAHLTFSERRTARLIASIQPENAEKVYDLLGGPKTPVARVIHAAAKTLEGLIGRVQNASNKVEEAIVTCESGMKENLESVAHAESLGKALAAYLAATDAFVSQAAQIEPNLVEPAKVFRQSVDALAGTSEMSLLIDLLEKRAKIERALHMRDVLEGLRVLRKHSEQTMAETMDATMSTELTSAVMTWYEKIRTSGDPDVHFSGFAMERTKSGDFKSRRLSVKAESYGVDLASAVSSLSESKLNALGLCVSIASAIRAAGPWDFLIVDDPIQSWDDEHETRFIDVIRSLVEAEKKQIVVLSHKGTWAKEVCQGCRTLNGLHYEITGYTKDGPNIAEMEWSPINQRLQEAEAIANDPTANTTKLQRGEAEIRLAACQMASQVAKEKLGRTTSAHNMNSKDVRAILVGAGVASDDLVDRLAAAFVTADDAHHAPKNYAPSPQRIRQAVSAIRDILKQTQKP